MLWCSIIVSNTSVITEKVYTAEANQNRPSGKVWREDNLHVVFVVNHPQNSAIT